MVDFMASVVHPSEVPNVHDATHSTPDVHQVVHQGSLGKGT